MSTYNGWLCTNAINGLCNYKSKPIIVYAFYFTGIGYKDIEYEDIGNTVKIALKNIQKLLVMYRKIAVI